MELFGIINGVSSMYLVSETFTHIYISNPEVFWKYDSIADHGFIVKLWGKEYEHEKCKNFEIYEVSLLL